MTLEGGRFGGERMTCYLLQIKGSAMQLIFFCVGIQEIIISTSSGDMRSFLCVQLSVCPPVSVTITS